MMMRLSRYTPPQTTTARQGTLAPVVVRTAVTRPFSVSISQTSACRSTRLSSPSSARRMRFW